MKIQSKSVDGELLFEAEGYVPRVGDDVYKGSDVYTVVRVDHSIEESKVLGYVNTSQTTVYLEKKNQVT